MWKWTKRIFLFVVITAAGYQVFDYYRAGLHTRPGMPHGAFSLSYKNGLRAIVVGVPDERAGRTYLGIPMAVPFYLEKSWTFCTPPTKTEKLDLEPVIAERNWPGERLEVICRLIVEGDAILRGYITSVPKV